jgi:hypothetical protein
MPADQRAGGMRAEAEELREMSGVPAFLDPELLESDSDSEGDGDTARGARPRRAKRPKRDAIERRLAEANRPPKDRVVGSTAYRISAPARASRLAPKAQKQSQNLKMQLLRRQRVAKTVQRGFFVKKR